MYKKKRTTHPRPNENRTRWPPMNPVELSPLATVKLPAEQGATLDLERLPRAAASPRFPQNRARALATPAAAQAIVVAATECADSDRDGAAQVRAALSQTGALPPSPFQPEARSPSARAPRALSGHALPLPVALRRCGVSPPQPSIMATADLGSPEHHMAQDSSESGAVRSNLLVFYVVAELQSCGWRRPDAAQH